MTLRRLLTALLPGFCFGGVVCGIAFWTRWSASGASAGDAIMGAKILLDVGSLPLSIISGGIVGAVANSASESWLPTGLEYGQVLLNWSLISLVVIGSWRRVRSRRDKVLA